MAPVAGPGAETPHCSSLFCGAGVVRVVRGWDWRFYSRKPAKRGVTWGFGVRVWFGLPVSRPAKQLLCGFGGVVGGFGFEGCFRVLLLVRVGFCGFAGLRV